MLGTSKKMYPLSRKQQRHNVQIWREPGEVGWKPTPWRAQCLEKQMRMLKGAFKRFCRL